METVNSGKDPDVGRDCRQKEKRVAEDKVVGWHPMEMNLGKLREMVRDREA